MAKPGSPVESFSVKAILSYLTWTVLKRFQVLTNGFGVQSCVRSFQWPKRLGMNIQLLWQKVRRIHHGDRQNAGLAFHEQHSMHCQSGAASMRRSHCQKKTSKQSGRVMLLHVEHRLYTSDVKAGSRPQAGYNISSMRLHMEI